MHRLDKGKINIIPSKIFYYISNYQNQCPVTYSYLIRSWINISNFGYPKDPPKKLLTASHPEYLSTGIHVLLA